jgi:MoaA/NifB/PqqE/SkfB family radical SAM enzyme
MKREDIWVYGRSAVDRSGLACGRMELTSACFQRCLCCDSWRYHVDGSVRAEWSLGNVQQLLEEALSFRTFRHMTFTGGDPQAWPHLTALLEWLEGPRLQRDFTIQLSTALARDADWEAWRKQIDQLWISLDTIDPSAYRLMRGDSQNQPRTILARLAQLKHPRYSTVTTVRPETIDEIPKIIDSLIDLARNGAPPRSAIFLAAIDHRQGLQDAAFWETWKRYEETAWGVPTSFASGSIRWTREWCQSAEAEHTRCWVPLSSFYAKANGDFYPCCITGGEAVRIHPEFKLGHFPTQSLRTLWSRYRPAFLYGRADSPCRSICQFKQAQFNLAAETAAATRLTMP